MEILKDYDVKSSIKKGLDFLEKSQLPHGEFISYEVKDTLSDSEKVNIQSKYCSSTYITTFILYSLGFIKDTIVERITEKALNFIKEEMEDRGVWRFYTANRNFKLVGGKLIRYTAVDLTPDLDCTACCAYSLLSNNIKFSQDMQIFLSNRNEQGIYYTWLVGFPIREYTDNTKYIEIFRNNICCGVNANILFYLKENENTKFISSYINDLICNGEEEKHNIYFHGKASIYYLISRAYYNVAPSLEKSKDIILSNLSLMQKEDGAFGDVLSTAFAVCTYLNFGCYNEKVAKGINYLLNNQNYDGSFALCNFFYGDRSYFGSAELTTAICLEALSRWNNKY